MSDDLSPEVQDYLRGDGAPFVPNCSVCGGSDHEGDCERHRQRESYDRNRAEGRDRVESLARALLDL
jgi:hypothetical protein